MLLNNFILASGRLWDIPFQLYSNKRSTSTTLRSALADIENGFQIYSTSLTYVWLFQTEIKKIKL